MSAALTNAMKDVRDLNHGDLKAFAVMVKGKLTRTSSPSEADFVDAVYEAAAELSEDSGITGTG